MSVSIKKLLLHSKAIFIWLVIFDLLILLLHIAFARVIPFFHLDVEQNLPTWYQSFKLLSFGFLFFLLSFNKKITLTMKTFTVPLAFFLIFLGFDELLQIHENIYRLFELFDWLHPKRIIEASTKLGYKSSLWVLYYLPAFLIFIFWCGYWFRFFQSKFRSNLLIIGLTSLLLLLVLIAEITSSSGLYSTNTYFWLVTIEETAEMLLASVLIYGGCRIFSKYMQ